MGSSNCNVLLSGFKDKFFKMIEFGMLQQVILYKDYWEFLVIIMERIFGKSLEFFNIMIWCFFVKVVLCLLLVKFEVYRLEMYKIYGREYGIQ